MLQEERAVEHIGQLPAPTEVLHGLMAPNYDSWDLVAAIRQLAQPATIVRLTAATLGFSRRLCPELCAALDAGQIGHVLLVVSHYFKGVDSAIFAELDAALTARGHQVVVLRSHCKLLLVELSDGQSIVVETSANLRASANVEQWSMSSSRELLDFHKEWIHQLIDETRRADAVRAGALRFADGVSPE